MDPVSRVPVLIIGGGIVGLSASLFLTQQGIKSVLVERHSGTSIHPRARSVNARTMELYRSLGIDDLVREAGASMSATMGIHSGGSLREVMEAKKRTDGPRKMPLSGLLASTSPAAGTFVTQDMIEPVLRAVAEERGGDLRFSTDRVGDVDQDEDGVTARLKDRKTGVTSTIRADYLIAADGAGSPIRTQLQIPTTGRGTMGYLLNILFHADLKSLVHQREFSLCMIDRPEVCGLFTSINNSDRWVFHLSYDPAKGETASDFTTDKCIKLLHLALGMPDIQIDIQSILPWEPSVRIAQRLQHGRIFLAGDAAHQMPPWAGQGANSGIADVSNLACKLAAVLKGTASKTLLETYDVERIPVGRAAAEASANAADERGIISTKKNLSTALSLWSRISLISGHGYGYTSKAICAESTFPLGGWTWRPWTLPSLFLSIDGRPGRRVPHIWVGQQGRRISTLDLCGSSFLLLAGSNGAPWLDAAKVVSSILSCDLDAYTLGPDGTLVDIRGEFEPAAGISSGGALLVRPDGFVVWRERRAVSDSQVRLEQAMRQALCLQ
ncbi:2,4-dichlorophenol 6-monooxygenase (FAD binding domain-containing protein) [Phlyctema vagabunda]|uniref:2,4-dichlorophenol 6-monooxygenase (FAD binding domain-containing protein) n=1 Tax=Phlyctema vagabunda TaxID=108571 RepID=A0ABR4PZ01_9HELO